MKGEQILVTGASGFIGGHVIDELRRQGYHPIRFDRRAPTDFLGDVRDRNAVSEAVGKCAGVIHLAAVLGTQETIDNPFPSAETNVFGSINVFQACREYRKRCVYIGVGNYWMNNPYSISKTAAERLALMFNKEHGTEIAIVRGLNAYGPRQKSAPVRKIIPNFVIPALRNEKITIYGDGSQVADMIYVRDLARILVSALVSDHGVYNVAFEAGTGRATTVREIAEEVVKQVGSGSLVFAPMRPGEPENSIVLGNPETLKPLDGKGAISMFPLIPLEEGLKSTIEWYRTWELH